MNKGSLIGLGVACAAAVLLIYGLKPGSDTTKQNTGLKLPSFSAEAQAGQGKFEANCMMCHGKHASGSKQGPPLVHIIYEPNHHSDASFYSAAKNGVRAHHWPYGDMPPIGSATKADVTKIIRYVRELQRANGIK